MTDAEEREMHETAKGWAAAGVLILLVPYVLYGSWVLSKLWAWYIVPIGAPPLTMLNACGLWLIGSFVTNRPVHYSIQPTSLSNLVTMIVYPTAALALGALYHWILSAL